MVKAQSDWSLLGTTTWWVQVTNWLVYHHRLLVLFGMWCRYHQYQLLCCHPISQAAVLLEHVTQYHYRKLRWAFLELSYSLPGHHTVFDHLHSNNQTFIGSLSVKTNRHFHRTVLIGLKSVKSGLFSLNWMKDGRIERWIVSKNDSGFFIITHPRKKPTASSSSIILVSPMTDYHHTCPIKMSDPW